MTRLALLILERALGSQRADAVLGDLEEDLAQGDAPRWARATPGLWFVVQALLHVTAARYNAPQPTTPSSVHSVRTLEVTTMWHDVRYALRSLRSTPTFTAVALVVLSLGIGATTAIFSIVDAVALRSLPYDEPDRLVQVGTVSLPTATFEAYQPPQNYVDWESRRDVFAALTAIRQASGFTLIASGAPVDLPTLQVTAGYFDVFRAYPQVGRAFTEGDQLPGAPRVALISDGVWHRQFGADPHVIGRTLHSTSALTYGAPTPLPAASWTIVGVMPRGFESPAGGPIPTEVWVPYVIPDNQRTRAGNQSAPLNLVGRLAEGVTVADADARIRAFTASLAEAHPEWFENSQGAVRSLHTATVGSARAWMLLLLGAVGVVLLIACANVANLTLARAMARSREMQTRAALGASRWRIARGLLLESLVLALSGSLLGLVVAVWGIDVLRAALPEDLPRISTVALNVRVLGFTALACVATGLFFGLAPAMQLPRSPGAPGGYAGSRSATAAGTRLRSALVVSEIALAVVLTIGAGLFLSSFIRVANVDLGLDPRHVLTMRVWPRFDSSQPDWTTPAHARSATTIPAVIARIEAMPGVESVGFIAGDLPLSGYSAPAPVVIAGRDTPFDNGDRVQVRHVTPGYARAVGTPLVRGRYLASTDTRGSAPVVVLNEEAVARYFGDRDPIGATLTIERGYAPVATVVGIVGNVRLFGPESAVRPEAYLPVEQASVLGGAFAIRTRGESAALADAVSAAVRESYPEIPTPAVETMTTLLGGRIAQRRFNMLIVGLFGGLALVISGVGLYGVMAYTVTQRTREIGVRLALGATPARVMAEVVGRGSALTALGITIGIAAAWPLATYVQSFLFQVTARDPFVYAATVGLLTVSGVTAAIVPARRAALVDPLTALRAD